ncbi:MAG TPA: GMC oxidoreductase, partial [Chitinophagales bacterium]|nr:GMC oxidoreductase [Chitinophagales bacterium]
QVCKEHAINAGFEITNADSFYNFDIWRKETLNLVPKSALNGELLYGNNNGIKNSLDRNYISDALGTGNLTIKTLSKVVEVSYQAETEKYTVIVETINERGILQETTTHQCSHLFVCAGSLGTSEILLKARETGKLPNLNQEVGNAFGTNGNAFTIRKNINKPTGNMHSSPPTLSVLDFNNPIAPLAAMQDIFPLGIDLRILLMVGQPYNEYKGSFQYQQSTNSIELNWATNGMDQPKQAMQNFIEKMNTANNSQLDTTFIKEGVSSTFTYHPLGGVVLDKASDNFGRLKGYKKLYAIDGSMLPGNCAMVNPSLTIAALAERNLREILNNDF